MRAPIRIPQRTLAIIGICCLAALVPGGRALADEVDTTRAWYDTLRVERPRIAHATRGERLALAAFAALSLPVGMVVGTVTLIPPTVVMRNDAGSRTYGLMLGTGIGLGADTAQLIYFPAYRIQFDGGYFFEREHPAIVHASVMIDERIGALDDDGFFWATLSQGLGVETDFNTIGPFLEAFLGVSNPLGIQYMPLYPMHHFGLRGRFGYDPATRKTWYELGVGMTSTFAFKL